jgi:hypothetical protein
MKRFVIGLLIIILSFNSHADNLIETFRATRSAIERVVLNKMSPTAKNIYYEYMAKFEQTPKRLRKSFEGRMGGDGVEGRMYSAIDMNAGTNGEPVINDLFLNENGGSVRTAYRAPLTQADARVVELRASPGAYGSSGLYRTLLLGDKTAKLHQIFEVDDISGFDKALRVKTHESYILDDANDEMVLGLHSNLDKKTNTLTILHLDAKVTDVSTMKKVEQTITYEVHLPVGEIGRMIDFTVREGREALVQVARPDGTIVEYIYELNKYATLPEGAKRVINHPKTDFGPGVRTLLKDEIKQKGFEAERMPIEGRKAESKRISRGSK